jgi:histidinol-phosphate aminotransferase
MYPEYARDTHTRWIAGRREEDFTLDAEHAVDMIEREKPSVVLLASPNNPTGTALAPATIEAVLDAAARVPAVVVVDEAYAEFRRAGTPSALELLAGHPHLAVTRTMSKAFAAAGLRLGYLAASPELVDALRVVRLPYHLSAITQAAARAALRHRAGLLAQVEALRAERDDLVAWLREQRFAGRRFDVAETDANFVLFGRFADRHRVWQGLLDRGVLIREVGPEGWLRVSVGTPEETAAFRTALTEVMAEITKELED